MISLYAKVLGVLLVLLGLVGLLVGEGYLFGVFNVDLFEDVLHLLTGTVFLYAGFGGRDSSFVNKTVGILSISYLLYALVGLLYSPLLGFLPDALTLVDNLFHLSIGAAGLVLVEFSRRGRTSKV